jgi:hypothetical protein
MTENLTIRAYEESDAEAIADLMNAVDAKHGAEAGWTGGELPNHERLGFEVKHKFVSYRRAVE